MCYHPCAIIGTISVGMSNVNQLLLYLSKENVPTRSCRSSTSVELVASIPAKFSDLYAYLLGRLKSSPVIPTYYSDVFEVV